MCSPWSRACTGSESSHEAPDDRQLRQLHLQPRAVLRRAGRRGRGASQRRDHASKDSASASPAASTRLVVSPGPCSPAEAGVSVAAIQAFAGKLPILGVCLGHQAIGAAFGGKIIRAQQLMHGKTSEITTTREGVFAGLPEKFTVNRYHSLAIERATCPERTGRHRLDRRRRDHGRAPHRLRARRCASRACSSIPNRSSPSMATPCSRTSWSEPNEQPLPTPSTCAATPSPSPRAAMRAAMMAAPLGDDVFGDDPSVNALQEKIAAMLGFEAALFVPTGTQSNLCAILSHCQRGDEYIVGQQAHCYRWEGGGAAVFGSVQPQPLDHQPDGTLRARRRSRPPSSPTTRTSRARGCWRWRTRWAASCCPSTMCRQATAAGASARGCSATSTARGSSMPPSRRRPQRGTDVRAEARRIAQCFDSVSVCFSKGLGAPVGSALCGSREFIARAHRIRKMAGGGMRQAGLLAAAASHALDHHVDRLADDHALAQRLARGPGGHRRPAGRGAADQHRVRRPDGRGARRARPSCWRT